MAGKALAYLNKLVSGFKMPLPAAGLAQPRIDMSYVDRRDGVTLSEEEMATVALSNGNQILEPADFDPDLLWQFELSESEQRLSSPIDLFGKYSRKMMTAMLSQRAPWIQDVWPDLYWEYLADVIIQHSEGVSELSYMLDLLLTALEDQSHLSKQDMLLWTVAWVNMFRLGMVHEQWIDLGHTPLLEDEPRDDVGGAMRRFSESSIDRLQDGRIQVGVMDHEMESSALAVFDHERGQFLYHSEYASEPLQQSFAGFKTFGLVSHELWHADQDAQQVSESLPHLEVEAELFEARVSLMLFGASYAEDRVLSYFKKQSLLMAKRYALNDIPSPIKILLDACINPNGRQASHMAMRLEATDIALSQMMGEEIDSDRLQSMREIYTQERFFWAFFQILELLDQNQAPNREVIESRAFKRFCRQSLRRIPRSVRYQAWFNPPEDPEDLPDFLVSFSFRLAQRLLWIYYHDGEESARDFYLGQIEPVLYDQLFPYITEHLTINMDGLSESRPGLVKL